MVRVPEAFDTAVGLNVIGTCNELPAVIFAGRVTPPTEKAVPLTVKAEIVRSVPPEFVSISLTLLLDPGATYPKETLEELAESLPGVTPVPESATVAFPFDASVVSEIFPLLAPAAPGVN